MRAPFATVGRLLVFLLLLLLPTPTLLLVGAPAPGVRAQFAVLDEDFPPHGTTSGPLAGGFPSYEERALLVWVGMVRVAPQLFRDVYLAARVLDGSQAGILGSVAHPPTRAATFDLNLARCARAHAEDVMACPHDPGVADCNGTTLTNRVARWYTLPNSSSVTEASFQIASGMSLLDELDWPLLAAAALVCGGTLHATGNFSACCADGDPCAADRAALMSPTARRTGCGLAREYPAGPASAAVDSTGDAPPAAYANEPIVVGAHVRHHTRARFGLFFAVARSPQRLQHIQIFLGRAGFVANMTLDGGDVVDGVWLWPHRDGIEYQGLCIPYWFIAHFEQGLPPVRYPPTGVFYSYGDNCTRNWDPDITTSSDAPPTTSATSVPSDGTVPSSFAIPLSSSLVSSAAPATTAAASAPSTTGTTTAAAPMPSTRTTMGAETRSPSHPDPPSSVPAMSPSSSSAMDPAVLYGLVVAFVLVALIVIVAIIGCVVVFRRQREPGGRGGRGGGGGNSDFALSGGAQHLMGTVHHGGGGGAYLPSFALPDSPSVSAPPSPRQLPSGAVSPGGTVYASFPGGILGLAAGGAGTVVSVAGLTDDLYGTMPPPAESCATLRGGVAGV